MVECGYNQCPLPAILLFNKTWIQKLENYIKITFLICQDTQTFFLDFTRVYSPRYYSSQLFQVFVLFHFSRKSQNKKFLKFFQLLAAFIEIGKCWLFHLSLFGLFDWQLPRKGTKLKSIDAVAASCSFNIIAPFQSPPLLNLAPCYIMEYFASI